MKTFKDYYKENNIWYKEKNFDIKDYGLFLSKIIEFSGKKKFTIKTLGKTDKYEILFLTRETQNKGPRLLISGGFHGEEGAGPWGIIRFLETVPDNVLDRCNISILPCVTVTGFIKHKRENFEDETANGGFRYLPDETKEDNTPSREGEILLKHEDLLVSSAKNGFLTLHEDSEEGAFYIYSFEKSNKPNQFSKILRNTGSKFFKLLKDKELEPPGGGHVVDGIVFMHHDGTYEDYMFSKGVPYCACTETPQRADIIKRIQVNVELISAFINYFI